MPGVNESLEQALLNTMNTTPQLIPSSRRYINNVWHPYGWKVSFWQTVQFANGARRRVHFSDIGVDRNAAIANALRRLPTLTP